MDIFFHNNKSITTDRCYTFIKGDTKKQTMIMNVGVACAWHFFLIVFCFKHMEE